MSPSYEGIEPQFDLAAQEAKGRAVTAWQKAAAVDLEALQEAIKANLAKKAKDLEALADQIEKEGIEAEQAEVPEVPGKVEQEPEVDMVCEAHPDREWPHDDCPGPGMPPRAVGGSGG